MLAVCGVVVLALGVAWMIQSSRSRAGSSPWKQAASSADPIPFAGSEYPGFITLRGIVRAERPLTGVVVRVFDFDGVMPRGDSALEIAVDEDGEFVTRLESPGWYSAVVDAPDCASFTLDFEVLDAPHCTVELGLGRVRLEGRVLGPAGEALEGVEVEVCRVFPEGDVTTVLHNKLEVLFTDSDGAFALDGLHPGYFEIRAAPDRSPDSLSRRCAMAFVSRPDLGSDRLLERVDIHLAIGASLRARVLAPDGRPAVGAEVHAYGASPYSEGAVTDENGLAVVHGLTPGLGRATAVRGSELSGPEALFGLSVAEEAEVTLFLVRGGSLRYRLEYSDGSAPSHPFEVLSVLVDSNGDDLLYAHRDQHESGDHLYPALLPGRYLLQVDFAGSRVEAPIEIESGLEQEVTVREPD